MKYVIDLIIYHGEFYDTHPTADAGRVLYRHLWLGFEPENDNWDQIDHLPHQKILIYYLRRRLIPPSDIFQNITGF